MYIDLTNQRNPIMANEKTHTEKGGKTRRAPRAVIKKAANKARRNQSKKVTA